MLLRETIIIALSSLRANRLRSALTMLGIVIGIAAVISVVGLGLGAQKAVDDRLKALGTTLLQINPQRVRRGGVQWGDPKRLTIADADALRERGTHFAAVQPQQDQNLQVVYRNHNTNAQITATTPNFLAVRGFQIDAGRMFTSGEARGMQRVAVLGSQVVSELGFLSPNALVGEDVRIGGRVFRVIGVLKSKGRGDSFGNPDEQVLIPLLTGRFRLFGNNRLNDIYVLAASDSEVAAATYEITTILRRSHRIPRDAPDDFRIRNQADFLSVVADTQEVFTYLLAGIAAVSLAVGGIGIMNIMLVSVTERTREIGVRKALGATRRTILVQFLFEAVTLCVSGGLVGVGIGAGVLMLMRHSGMTTTIAPQVVALAIGFAGFIGVLFGVWPARRAASLDPIVALRHE